MLLKKEGVYKENTPRDRQLDLGLGPKPERSHPPAGWHRQWWKSGNPKLWGSVSVRAFNHAADREAPRNFASPPSGERFKNPKLTAALNLTKKSAQSLA
jgi:hypothetical protein